MRGVTNWDEASSIIPNQGLYEVLLGLEARTDLKQSTIIALTAAFAVALLGTGRTLRPATEQKLSPRVRPPRSQPEKSDMPFEAPEPKLVLQESAFTTAASKS